MIEENINFELKDNSFESILLYKNKDTFIDDKERIKIIKNIESLVRTSNEYKEMMSYIKKTNELNKCSILNGINSDDAKLEIHHNCLNLFDIVEIVIKRFNDCGEYWNSFIIADKVMDLHYNNMISLIPLSTTIHQYVHSRGLIFNKEYCIGDIQIFYDMYHEYMTEEQLEKFDIYMNSNIKLEDIQNNITSK